MGGPVVVISVFALVLGLLAAGSGSQPQPPSPGPEPGPQPGPQPGPAPRPGPRPPAPEPDNGAIPPNGDEGLFDHLTDSELIRLSCVLWTGRVGRRGGFAPSETDRDLAFRLLKGLFPGMDWANPLPGSKKFEIVTRAEMVFSRLRSGEVLCDDSIEVYDVPSAGHYYQIEKGDTPFGIVNLAYPQFAGSAPGQAQKRIQAVKMITNDPRNGGGVVGSGICVATTGQTNINLIGPVVFSMYPNWQCQPKTNAERFQSGPCFAVVYLPEI